jgi:hypothetical protein
MVGTYIINVKRRNGKMRERERERERRNRGWNRN